MTTPLIEAIARALCINDDRNPDDPFFVNSPDGLRQWKGYEFDTMTALTAITTAGYAVVPVEPTEAMIEAARDVPFIAMGNGEYLEPDRSDIYRAMITAAQGDG